MSETGTAPDATEETTSETPKGFSWASLLRGAAIAAIVLNLVINVLAGLIPPLLVFVVLWAIGIWLLRRPGKAGPIFLLVVFVIYLALNLSGHFVIPQLAAPASTFDFVLALAALIVGILGVVSGIAILRRGRVPSGAARALGRVAVGLFVAGIILSVIANATFDDAELQEGDIELTTLDIEFSPTEAEAQAPEVSVFITNDDPVLHTFTIDELGVDLDIPAGKTARISFDAEPGTYRFYCVPHQPDMEGELTVK